MVILRKLLILVYIILCVKFPGKTSYFGLENSRILFSVVFYWITVVFYWITVVFYFLYLIRSVIYYNLSSHRCYFGVIMSFIYSFNLRANAVCNYLRNNYKLTLTGLLQEFIWGSVFVFSILLVLCVFKVLYKLLKSGILREI